MAVPNINTTDLSHLVSVIIPVYNSARHIADTLSSCTGQSYENIEIIVVNDGSTDNSEEVIQAFSDDRIRYFKIPNGGACVARNFGIQQAKGALIQFLDADDILDKDKLLHQVSAYQQHGDGHVYISKMGSIIGNEKDLQNDFELYERNFKPLEYFEILLNQFGKYLTTGAWLVPAKIVHAIDGWDPLIKLNQDGEYFMRVVLNSEGIVYCKDAVFYYRRDVSNSVSKKRSKAIYESWLYSYHSYAKQFAKHFDAGKANKLGWAALSVYYCTSYPNHPDLLRKCRAYMKELGYSSPKPHGGQNLVKLARLIGTIPALKILALKNWLKA